MKQQTVINAIKVTLIVGAITFIIAFTMTSCRSGYGCHGNQSWGKMVNRINRP
jgi:hypothetical protein